MFFRGEDNRYEGPWTARPHYLHQYGTSSAQAPPVYLQAPMLPYGVRVYGEAVGVPQPAFIPIQPPPRLCHLKEAPHCHTVHPLGDAGTCCAGNCIVDARMEKGALSDGRVVYTGRCHM